MQRRKCTLKRLNLSCLFQDSSNLFKTLYSLSCNPHTSLSLSGIMIRIQSLRLGIAIPCNQTEEMPDCSEAVNPLLPLTLFLSYTMLISVYPPIYFS